MATTCWHVVKVAFATAVAQQQDSSYGDMDVLETFGAQEVCTELCR